jgi:WD40 repeat protein
VEVFSPSERPGGGWAGGESVRQNLGPHGFSVCHATYSSGRLGKITGLAFSPDGSRLATASDDDRTARVWDATTGTEVARVEHEKGVPVVAFSADGTRIATGSRDMTARVWDAETGAEVACLAHQAEVTGVAFAPAGPLLATAAQSARVWDVDSGEEVTAVSHEPWVQAVAFSPTGRQFATAGGKFARVWEAVA